MKKVWLVLASLIWMGSVEAANVGVSIACPDTMYEGDTVNCLINSSTSNGLLSGIKGNFEITNGTYTSFTAGSSWVVYASNSNGFVIGNTSGGVTGSAVLGTLKIASTAKAGEQVKIKLTNLNASDIEYNDIDIANKEATVNVVAKEIIDNTNNSGNSNTGNNNNTGNINNKGNNTKPKDDVYLDTLSVEGYNIVFTKNKYVYDLEVSYDIEYVNILATSKYSVSGIGKKTLDKDENVVNIVVSDGNVKRTYTINIKKVKPITDKVSNNVEDVTKALEKFDEIYINVLESDDPVALKSILEKIYKIDKKITYNVYDDENKLLYSYVFNGNDMDYILDNIPLKINMNDDNIEFVYKSYFPNDTIVKLYDYKTSGNLYKINSENALELIDSKLKYEEGSVALKVEKGDKYTITEKEEENGSDKVIVNRTNPLLIFLMVILILACVEFSCYVVYKYVKLKKSIDDSNNKKEIM